MSLANTISRIWGLHHLWRDGGDPLGAAQRTIRPRALSDGHNPGLARPRQTTQSARALFVRRSGWRWEEIVFWVLAAASYFIFPDHLVLITQAMITGSSWFRSTSCSAMRAFPRSDMPPFSGSGLIPRAFSPATGGAIHCSIWWRRPWWRDRGRVVQPARGAAARHRHVDGDAGIGLICYEIANNGTVSPAAMTGFRVCRSGLCWACSRSISRARSASSIRSSSSSCCIWSRAAW